MTTASQELVERVSPVIFALSLNSYAFSFTLLSELGVQSLNSTTDLIVFAARVAIDAMSVERLLALGVCLTLSMSFLYVAVKSELKPKLFLNWLTTDKIVKCSMMAAFCSSTGFLIWSETLDVSDWSYGWCFLVIYSPVFIWYTKTMIHEKGVVVQTRWLAVLMMSAFIGSAYLGSYAAPKFIVFPGVMHKETAKLFLWDDSGGTSYVDCNDDVQRVEVWKGVKDEPLYYYYVANTDLLGSVCERSFQ